LRGFFIDRFLAAFFCLSLRGNNIEEILVRRYAGNAFCLIDAYVL
jgi:hypothetical protein